MEEAKATAYKSLRYRIITHDLRPGQPLNEKDLMDEYQIGRTPLREVLLRLQRDGLIQRFPRSGTFVSSLDLRVFKQIVEIRIDLEAFAARLAAERVTKDQLDVIRQTLQKAKELEEEESADLDALTQCEFDFHDIVYEASNNEKLKDILHELHGISTRFWYYLVFDREELLSELHDLAKVLDALENRDGQRAAQVMANHIRSFVEKARDKIL